MAETRDTPAAIIYPPLDIKVIVDKTAGHVAKSGDAFQQLIREKYQGQAKFSFIYPNDPYYAYYSHMVEKYKSGDTTDTIEIADSMEIDIPLVEAPERPDALQFAHAMPAISAQDLDVIKLTAQFVARNGRQFMTMLAQRESQNYQFDFMSPAHSLFPYFRKLVDQYTLVFFPTAELCDRVERDRENKHQILDRVNRRMKWAAFEEEERQRKGREAEKEKEAFLSIDWHDFVVVGTVEFVEEDAFVDLPGPLRLQDLAAMSLEDKHNSLRVANGEAPKPKPTQLPTTVQSAQPPTAISVKSEEEDEDDNDVEMETDEDDENIDEEIEAERNPKAQLPALTVGPMKIRKDYVPTLRRGPQIAKVTLQCQLCHLQIPASEFEEHIRVELIDPKWKEQKLIYEGKLRDSNLVQEGMDIARYLKQMATHRSDTYGQEATSSTAAPPVIWDGYSSTAGQATRRARENMSAEDQVAATHRKMGLRDPRDTTPQIGPQMGPPTIKRQKK
ncbi:SF3a splicing factor complex subunit [Coemansia pectinata]|uniref:SF3a splicing factor complex subunit n=1 Tax=Coemansia pectinata TaxID=1052879 RepID=A0A9W8GYT0_9FUNG|nr:SF3a splicing factor complex subunit [Coemansia pectinata]